MILVILTLVALCVIVSGATIIILEILVTAGEADPSESAVRYVLSGQSAWVTLPVALAVGAILISLSGFVLYKLFKKAEL